MNTSGAVVSQPWLLTMRTKTESKKRGIIGLQSDDPSERQEIAPPTLTFMLCVVYHGRHLLKRGKAPFYQLSARPALAQPLPAVANSPRRAGDDRSSGTSYARRSRRRSSRKTNKRVLYFGAS